MVTIVDCVSRFSHEGNEFVAFILQGELEVLTSKSGNMYVSAKKASIPSTLDIDNAKMMIGKTLPGTIEKVECPAYEHVNSDGELVHLNHRWQYVPEITSSVQHQEQYLELEELETETV